MPQDDRNLISPKEVLDALEHLSKDRDFCRHCGARIPPIFGEGTCERCDPEGAKRNRTSNESSSPRTDGHPEVTNYADLVRRLREAFRYDPDTGILSWAESHGRAVAGEQAGWLRQDGYREVKIDGEAHRVHRLIWLMVHGTAPDGSLDHANGNRSDNRLSNLRLATLEENNRNARKPITNKSGIKGVSFNRCAGRWVAAIWRNGRQKHLGVFRTKKAAELAVREARQALHGEFARHG